MEEFVGQLWHRWVSGRTEREYVDAAVALADICAPLTTYYRALGGDPGKRLEGATARESRARRRWLERLAGANNRFVASWQDERSLRLPVHIALFPEATLNEALYYWLAALAAKCPQLQHWFLDNQRITQQLLAQYPGLRASYQRLVQASLAIRGSLSHDHPLGAAREAAIRQALLEPGSVMQLPYAERDPLPIPLWLYPAPMRGLSAPAGATTPDASEQKLNAPQQLLEGQRKSAERIEDERKTDGLMVFQLASLFSWAEQVAVDRCQDENTEDDSSLAAQECDVITLARQQRAGAAKVKFDLDLPAAENDDLPLGQGIRLPEWDYRKNQLIDDFCLLQPLLADAAPATPLPEELRVQAHQLRKRFSLLRPQREWHYRQASGEEIDLSAYLEACTRTQRQAELSDVFKARTASQRDLSCLLLADLSMSTDTAISEHQRTIDVIRDTLLLLAEALHSCGDRFAVYGFSSVKNKQIRYQLLKNFSEPYADINRGRIQALKPGFYTRMGAAIRQSTLILSAEKSQQRLLLILSDGKPNDIDHYEGRYGIEDTRQAVIEAKQAGLTPFCVTVDAKGNDYLPYLFGHKGYAVVQEATRLPQLLPQLYLNLTAVSH